MQPLLTAYFPCKHFAFIVYTLNTKINYIMEITLPPVNCVISLFMRKVILTIITKPS